MHRNAWTLIFLLSLTACFDESKKVEAPEIQPIPTQVKGPVRVQHILIAFQGSLPHKKVERSFEEAEKLAKDLLERAKKEPEKFEDLVRAYSDDQVPGIYEMVDFGEFPNEKQHSRASMVVGFGDLAFQLQPNQIALLSYDSKRSPYGFHVLKRIQP